MQLPITSLPIVPITFRSPVFHRLSVEKITVDLSVAEAITEAGKPPIIPKDHEVLATYGFFVGTIDGAVIVSVSYN